MPRTLDPKPSKEDTVQKVAGRTRGGTRADKLCRPRLWARAVISAMLVQPSIQQPEPPAGSSSGTIELGAAASTGQTELAKALVQQGVDVNSPDPEGRTPVILAVIGGHLDTAVQLSLSGADLARCDNQGHTALHHAIAANNRQVERAGLAPGMGPEFTGHA